MPTNNPDQHASPPAPRGAADAAGQRIEHGGRRVEETIERLEKTAEDVASGAIDRVRAARDQATSGIAQQRDQVAERIQKLGEVLRSGSEYLRRDDPLAHEVLTYASDRANGLASYVREATPAGLADDLQTFAKRRPGVFFGGAFLLGLAVGRFVKSSTPQGGGGDRDAALGYGEPAYDEPDYAPTQPRRRATLAAPEAGRSRTAQEPVPAQRSQGTSASAAGSASPSVSSGSALGASPSSASYGASTAVGTSGASESTTPSYGSAVPATSTAPVVKRPGQMPSLREVPEETPNPRPHAVREGEGTKS